jgi:AMP-binding enzyme C-terminal domain
MPTALAPAILASWPTSDPTGPLAAATHRFSGLGFADHAQAAICGEAGHPEYAESSCHRRNGRIELAQVRAIRQREAVIYEQPAVREAAVFGIPDPQWGELVMACVVLKPGKALTVDDLISHCRRSLANYKIPRRVEFSETELPKSGSGKILKRILRERFWAHQERPIS